MNNTVPNSLTETSVIPYRLPPRVHRQDGQVRRVGFELEFSGLSLASAAQALQVSLGGHVGAENPAELEFQSDALGQFNIELDWQYLKQQASEQQHAAESGDNDWLAWMSEAAALLVPMEVVCPPIAVTDLAVLDPMVSALRDVGAAGTETSLLAAYGVHLNPELPQLDASTIDAHLKAFGLLQWWLAEAHDVDFTRELSPYIALYSEDYLKQLLARASPTLDQLFDDYLEHNATRNRALDLLPLLAELDAQRVRQVIDDPRIKARPTFHYRLPNCQIEKPEWSLAIPWNTWCVVERLAGCEESLAVLAQDFLAADWPLLGVNRQDWVEHMEQWLKSRGWV